MILPPLAPPPSLGYAISPDNEAAWKRHFPSRPLPLLLSTEDIDRETAALHADIDSTTESTCAKRKPFSPRAVPWWNEECGTLAAIAQSARDEDRKAKRRALRKATVKAKREWANDIVSNAKNEDLWRVAKWRHGRRVSFIPAILTNQGLSSDEPAKAEAFRARFFNAQPPDVPVVFPDDPLPLAPRELAPITQDEVATALSGTSNKSAPGPSGQSYLLIKWAFSVHPARLTQLFNACLRLGHHPPQWREATVAVVPKPNRTDPSLPKNYRPISLLECLGKLLEKIISTRILFDINFYELVPTTQFGGRNASSTVDAGLCLQHDIRTAHASGLVCASLLFDISGFFDNINHHRLVAVFRAMGFPPELVGWLKSFLTDRHVKLKFNGFSSAPYDLKVGTPQGSPISPVLSIIFASPILHLARRWQNTGLSMYVDDGNLFACGATFTDVTSRLRSAYRECWDWLHLSGLAIEPDKTEVIFFTNSHAHQQRPPHIWLADPSRALEYRVEASNTVRYLGIFFDHQLNWHDHVRIMTNRARSTLKALQLLGNSIRGLSWAQWRTVYNAVILPILTYAAPVWYTGQARLLRDLRTAQNEAARHMAGAFCTTPVDPLLQLMGVMPIDIRIKMLIKNASLRLYRLPPSSQLLARASGPWGPPRAGLIPIPIHPPRRKYRSNLLSLTADLPAAPRINMLAAPPWQLDFSAPRFLSNHRVRHGDERKLWINAIKTNLAQPNSVSVFARGSKSNWNRDDDRLPTLSVATLFSGPQEVAHAERNFGFSATAFDADLVSLASAAFQAQLFLNQHPSTPQITIYSTNPAAIQAITNLRPHSGQSSSRDFCDTLTRILSSFRSTHIKLEWCPSEVSIAGIKRCIDLARSIASIPLPANHREPHTVAHQMATSKELAISTWQGRAWHNVDRQSQSFLALPSPPTGDPPPVIQGAAGGSRKASATLIRISTGHAFIGSYYSRFHPRKPTRCPECGTDPQTVAHVLQECPRYARARAAHLTPIAQDLSLSTLLGTKKGGKALISFLEVTKACFTPAEHPHDPG
jgi:Reverse transcriptase (RNA-dependent DNA polymerase)